MRDVHWCVTVFYQQIENGNIADQIHGFTVDNGKLILMLKNKNRVSCFECDPWNMGIMLKIMLGWRYKAEIWHLHPTPYRPVPVDKHS